MEFSGHLRQRQFEPVLFQLAKKNKGEKRVDTALTREMLVNAFDQNFDVGVLVAGDEDYVDLVNEVKRYGPRVHGAFFPKNGMSDELRLQFDKFHNLYSDRLASWEKLVRALKEELAAPK